MDEETDLKHEAILECIALIKIKQDMNKKFYSVIGDLFDTAYKMGVEDGYKVAMELDDLMTGYYK